MNYPDLEISFFPPENVLNQKLKNLIAYQTNPLIGRAAELDLARNLIQKVGVRLLTLVGPGGVGKTRLALQLATGLVEDYQHLYFVPLAGLRHSELVLPALAEALEIKESPAQTLLEQLKERLQSQQHLLVLDNFEQLLDSRFLLDDLLGTIPSLKLIVTSRIPLKVAAEHQFSIPPLKLPDLMDLPSNPERLAQIPAVHLFEHRVRTLRPDFKITEHNLSDIARICVRLDGLPLALELAAGWMNLLSPQALLKRLEQPLQLLVGGPVNAPERHQTLRNTIEWSYNLLNSVEQRLFRQLAVFAGGCTIEGAEAICYLDCGGVDFLQNLRSLVNKSLLHSRHLEPTSVGGQTDTRLSMLETIHEYAFEILQKDPDLADLRQRHLEYYLAFALQAIPQLQGAEQLSWLDRLDREHPNLRSALQWSVRQDPSAGLRLAASLAQYWDFRGHLKEGRQWLQELLAASEGEESASRAKALNAVGNLALKQGDYHAAIAFQEESLALHRTLGDRRSIALVLNNLGVIFYHLGQYERAGTSYQESLILKRELGNPRSLAMSLNNLGELAQLQGHPEQAKDYYQEALALQRKVGDQREVAVLLFNLADLSNSQGEPRRAAGFLAESLQLFQTLNDKLHLAPVLEELGRVAAMEKRAEVAGQLFGAAAALRETIGSPLSKVYQIKYDGPIQQARQQLGENGWQQASQAGKSLPLEQVFQVAQSIASTPPHSSGTGELSGDTNRHGEPQQPESSEWGQLVEFFSDRELEVLHLIAQGLTNQQIASKLVVTPNTVKWHLKNIYQKLNVNSRTQALSRAKELKLFS